MTNPLNEGRISVGVSEHTLKKHKVTKVSVREEVQWFSGQMEGKLRVNDHKGGWTDDKKCIDPNWLLQRLREETDELEKRLNPRCGCREACCGHSNYPIRDLVISECADVANFAMMIADIARKLL